ncbi:hypothetical protein SAMN02799624_05824 [Paenibacillus sp. UNC496MF]|uniref:hypothetical protein n=1 Tax=Paenibacillus sp. UNC496MF TaxID=1502753 RepID=UPI0008F1DEA2|nr:hypothetical protein [Paenibacillus sp. UNC496MF]SFJ76102.1 hypothetical protein SAMN02799624_05824 [Paenibacillus sp. UNC496MF]
MLITMSFYFNSFIGTKEKAALFLEILEKQDLLPDKVGIYEPLKVEFSKEVAIELWSKAEQGKDRITGGLMGKKKNPSFSFIMEWNKGQKYIRPNWVTLYVADNAFNKSQQKFIELFLQINDKFNGLYSYISTEKAIDRQFVPGGLDTRLPGVFWCNYFSKTYVDFFGEKKLLNGPWFKSEEYSNAIVTFLTKSPADSDSDENLENELKRYLGENSFGDRKYYLDNLREIQVKNVPKFELIEIKI